jgi:hypothetical protein
MSDTSFGPVLEHQPDAVASVDDVVKLGHVLGVAEDSSVDFSMILIATR